MISRTVLGADGKAKAHEIKIETHGTGGAAGIKTIQSLAGMIESLKACKTPQEVYDRYMTIIGYCKCCTDSGFLDEKGADELMSLAAYLAGNEQRRAEVEQRKGKV